MNQNYQSDARRVVIDFLQSNPDPGDQFWSVRDISRRYNFSDHASYNILRILNDMGYLDLVPKRRASIRKNVDLSLLGKSIGPLRPAFIWPSWKEDEPGNFIAEFAKEISGLCDQLKYPFICLDNPSAWGSSSLAHQLKAISANALLTVAPPPQSLILFTRLKMDEIPIVSLGSARQGYDDLGIATINGDSAEAMRLLMLRLRSFGVEAPLVVGYGDSVSCHAEKVAGLSAAFPEIEDVEAAGFFTNVGEPYSQVRELKCRLSLGRFAPDALIFSDSSSLELAINSIPTLGEGARKGLYYIAVFDDTGLGRRLKFPVISITLQAYQLAVKSLELLQSLRNGERVARRTLLRRIINWPAGLPEKKTAGKATRPQMIKSRC